MAKHSKYDNIKHRKAAQDAKKGKIYSLHAKLIALAAQSGWDPDKNPNLAMHIEKAKKDWVPNENIDRAIKKGTGEDKSGVQIQEIMYEWYWPGWVAILVNVLTDNKNRSASSIRHIFSKYGGNMWESGAVSWMFNRKWVIVIDSTKNDYDKVEELVYETSAEDISKDDISIEIITSSEDLEEVKNHLESNGVEIESYENDYLADNEIELGDFERRPVQLA